MPTQASTNDVVSHVRATWCEYITKTQKREQRVGEVDALYLLMQAPEPTSGLQDLAESSRERLQAAEAYIRGAETVEAAQARTDEVLRAMVTEGRSRILLQATRDRAAVFLNELKRVAKALRVLEVYVGPKRGKRPEPIFSGPDDAALWRGWRLADHATRLAFANDLLRAVEERTRESVWGSCDSLLPSLSAEQKNYGMLAVGLGAGGVLLYLLLRRK